EHGLFRYFADGRVERFNEKDGLPHPHVRDILVDPDGTVWIATGLGLCRLVANVRPGEPIVARVYTKKDGMFSDGIFDLFRTKSGWLWLGTALGLSEFTPDAQADGGHFINYTREHGFSDAGIQTIAEDHDGNLWLGTESGGAMKITRRGFTSYSEADGLEHARIAALGEDRNGEFFVVTGSLKVHSFHIHRFDGRRFENFPGNLPAGMVPSWGWNQLFVQDRSQQWWVPANSGLVQYPALRSIADFANARPLKVYTTQNGLTGNEPFRLYEDSRGDIWISIISSPANSYLNRWERATASFITTNRKLGCAQTVPQPRFRKTKKEIFGSDFTTVVSRVITTVSSSCSRRPTAFPLDCFERCIWIDKDDCGSRAPKADSRASMIRVKAVRPSSTIRRRKDSPAIKSPASPKISGAEFMSALASASIVSIRRVAASSATRSPMACRMVSST